MNPIIQTKRIALACVLMTMLVWLPESAFSQAIPQHILDAIIQKFGPNNVRVQRESIGGIGVAGGQERSYLDSMLSPPVRLSYEETRLNSLSPDSVGGSSSLAGDTFNPSSNNSELAAAPAIPAIIWVVRVTTPIGLWESLEWLTDTLRDVKFCGIVQGSHFGVTFHCDPEFRIEINFVPERSGSIGPIQHGNGN